MQITAPFILSTVAIIISVLSVYISLRLHHDSRELEIINQIYGIYNEGILTLIQNKSLNHMVELPENYQKTKALVQDSCRGYKKHEISDMLLKERAAALYVFQIFEHFCCLFDHAKKIRAKTRIAFLEMVFGYFTEKLLRNPRLLYYWDESGGNLQVHYEKGTVEYFNREVLAKIGNDLKEIIDFDGPFIEM